MANNSSLSKHDITLSEDELQALATKFGVSTKSISGALDLINNGTFEDELKKIPTTGTKQEQFAAISKTLKIKNFEVAVKILKFYTEEVAEES